MAVALTWLPGSAAASLENDRYDGNIFALYAGNGSLVPPRSSLAQSLEAHRTAVLVFYLDDSSVSKRFAPVVSELQRLWGNRIDLIPLVTDPLQGRPDQGPSDPAHYWKGVIPEVVVIDGDGKVRFDASGAVAVAAIDEAISQATGLPLPAGGRTGGSVSINELNSELVNEP
ncbi:MAG: thylakoid membrane photosystem I accumulation factor [Synechococcaceae cyanobacterium]|nr:thylakoid membrane photosystem I accumulation factor [Synechococcaceae cyanobacterium]